MNPYSVEMNSCIFCLESDNNLVYNVKCRCNYSFHMACYEYYDRKEICPLCRAVVGHFYNLIEEAIEIPVVPQPVALVVPEQPYMLYTYRAGVILFIVTCTIVIITTIIVAFDTGVN